jgi:hypothetical protein
MTAFILTTAMSLAGAAQNPEQTLDEKVATARDKAIAFLKNAQDKDGTWEGSVLSLLADMNGGVTALATLALLEAGAPANDPAVTKAVAYLVKLEPKKTYVVSLQTQVLCRVKDKKHLPRIQNNADWLLGKAIKRGGNLEGWSYPGQDLADNSNTHFAVVALGDAAKAGAKIEAKTWEQIRDFYTRTQLASGWGYYSNRAFGGDHVSLSMTTSALLGLIIAAKNDKNSKDPDPAFEKGMAAWLKLASGAKSRAYEHFATAELGRVLGTTEFKAGKMGRAWYREGAERLLQLQQADGSFVDKGGIDAMPVLATSFGLYFLGPPAKK